MNARVLVGTLLICCIGLGIPQILSAQPGQGKLREDSPPTIEELLEWHEFFRFEVKYMFMKLGEVEVEVVNDTLYRGYDAWHLRGVIRSSGLPLTGDEENHYHSIFNVKDGQPRELVYWKDNVDEEIYDEERFEYNYRDDKVYAFKEGEPTDTLELKTPATSGPLVFFYSRMRAGSVDTSQVNIYLEGDQGIIDLWSTTRIDERGYDAFEDDVDTYYSEGDADINGPFGFRGRFRSWFVDDPLRIPVESRLKVWIGNVKVRLIEYKREKWDEPHTF